MNRRKWISSSAVLGSTIFLNPTTIFSAQSAGIHRGEGMVKLSSNENPYGPSAKAREAIQRNIGNGNRYPNDLRKQLIYELSKKVNVDIESILLGAGSSDLLQVLACWCVREKLHLTTSALTFDVLPMYVKRFGGQLIKTKLTHDGGIDLDTIENVATKNPGVVYLVNPNNPTGSKVDYKDLIGFCERVSEHSYIIVDEAYIEYVENNESVVHLIKQHPRLIVVRTFSKIYGLAGLRVGYALANPELAKRLRSYQVWSGSNLSNLGIAAAIASLKDPAFIKKSRLENDKTRKYTLEELRKLKRYCVEPHANFIWFKCNPFKLDLGKIYAENNLIVGTGEVDGDTWMRVTIGKKETMQRFIEVAKSIWI